MSDGRNWKEIDARRSMILEHGWKPILDPQEATVHVLPLVKEIAHRLQNPRNVKLSLQLAHLGRDNSGSGQIEAGTAGGWAGLALLFRQLDQCFPRHQWEYTSLRYLRLASSMLTASSGILSLTAGLSGLGITVDLFSEGGVYHRSLQNEIDSKLCFEIDRLEVDRLGGVHGISYNEYDVVSGWAGVISYLVRRRTNAELGRRLQRIISALCGLVTNSVMGVPSWHTPSHLAVGSQFSKRYPRGFLNCGFAHGIPGILAALSTARLYGIENRELELGICAAVEWILKNGFRDEWGLDWEAVVSISDTGPKANGGTRAAWCYGSPGVAYALWRAGTALGNEHWKIEAKAAIRSWFRRPSLRLGSPTFCHGISGLTAMCLRIANEDSDVEFSEFARRGVTALMAMRADDALFGFYEVEQPGVFVNRPDLLSGAAGILLTLLAASSDFEPTWDRALLLS